MLNALSIFFISYVAFAVFCGGLGLFYWINMCENVYIMLWSSFIPLDKYISINLYLH